jgi:hypothetical protein
MPSRRRDQVQSLDEQLETMAECARRVLGQTKAPIVQGVTQCADKLLSVFEVHTELIRKGRQVSPTSLESWSRSSMQRARSSRIMRCSRSARVDRHLLRSAVEAQHRKLGRVPSWWLGDAGFYSPPAGRRGTAVGSEVCFGSEPEESQSQPPFVTVAAQFFASWPSRTKIHRSCHKPVGFCLSEYKRPMA